MFSRMLPALTAALLTFAASGAQAQFSGVDLPMLTFPADTTTDAATQGRICPLCPKPAE